ncbi:MAG: hypothetical protein IKS98_13315 [Lachnospiraceae bacterium]|nr:hypothetical protein [Lachnospiraceae bacterium]
MNKDYLKNEIARLRKRLADAEDALARATAEEEAKKKAAEARRKAADEAIHKLWKIYWPNDDSNVEERFKNDVERNPHMLFIWLVADTKAALKLSGLDGAKVEEIKNIVSKTGIDFDKCYDDARIRLHFSEALKSVNEGSDLAALLGYSFSPDDLMELMELHKKNMFRKKIEDMLTGANFHGECGLLCSQQYEGFADFVKGKGA